MESLSWSAIIADNDHEHTVFLKPHLEKLGIEVLECLCQKDIERTLTAEKNCLFAFISLDAFDDKEMSLLGHESLKDMDIALMHTEDDPLTAMQGIKQGATYFFCKPLDAEFITDILKDALNEEKAHNKEKQGKQESCSLNQFGLLRGSSKPMYSLYRALRKVSQTDASVLLVGESGTGKELAARTIHELSERWDKPFVAMNCGAISPELVESELFGHEKGSFSGADKKRIGYFEQAEGGTLFLDEIGEMPMDMQVKFLRVLESREYRRVGGEQALSSNVRIIAASNRDPLEAIKQQRLRKDLYFRIAQFPLYLPPLRERGGDVVGLAQYFLNEQNEKKGTHKVFSQNVLDLITDYPWPGNVRELRSAIERAYIMADDVLDSEHFPHGKDDNLEDSGDILRVSVGSSLDDTEKKLIFATLEKSGGDKKKTAKQLGISLKTLYNKLNGYEDIVEPLGVAVGKE